MSLNYTTNIRNKVKEFFIQKKKKQEQTITRYLIIHFADENKLQRLPDNVQ